MPAIVTGHPATTTAGLHAFHEGGNAFDALISAWLAACVAEPVLTSPSGGGFALVAPASGSPFLLDFFAQTPAKPHPEAHTEAFEADFGSTRQVFHLGPASIAVPGCIHGLLEMHSTFGMLPLRECAQPARQLAREGLAVTDHAARLFSVVNDLYAATPACKALFRSQKDEEGLLREGDHFSNPDFVAFLDQLCLEGSRWFYEGDIGKMIAAFCQENGGHLQREDFERYRSIHREPLIHHYGKSRIFLNPAPSIGGVLVALGLAHSCSKAGSAFPPKGHRDWEAAIGPIRLMSQLRATSSGNPLPAPERQRMSELLALNPHLREPLASVLPEAESAIRAHGTTHISVVDDSGNEISMTSSNGSGSAVVLEGTGFVLNNMLGEEDLLPQGLQSWKPATRLASMMVPTLACLPDGQRLLTGSGGSNRIRSTVLQVLRNTIEHGMPLEAAVAAPRIHWESGELHVESELLQYLPENPPEGIPELAHAIEHSVPNLFFGGAHSLMRSPSGEFELAPDLRRGGTGAVL
jgi:gamma-glutamyltranspeptidase/glutathione hydrolase